jgi:imidazole glycerol-phosphate synthase subunit HisH
MKSKVCIVDYGVNNLLSVIRTLEKMEIKFDHLQGEQSLLNYSHIILPGVGSFNEGARRLEETGLKDSIRNAVFHKERRILGICLGMQLLFESSDEFNTEEKGLELLPGKCIKLKESKQDKIYVPHIGWNEVQLKKTGKLLHRIDDGAVYYFVHSYHVQPTDLSIIASTCLHGEEFVATIEHDNIFGCQFHPEKSYNQGFQVLSNFLAS